MDFKNKRITIMGLGMLGGGVGTVEYLCKHGAVVTVTDLQTEKELKTSIGKLSDYNINFVLGEHKQENFIKADMVIRNPAVPAESKYLQSAKDHNVPIEMAESLFLKLSPTKNIIGVSGTRGKSTTSAMIHRILKEAGYDSYLAGNQKDTSTLQLLDHVNEKSYVVLELSSWQLESFGWHKLSPHIAVITNIYPDHLNRYKSMNDYINDKKNIYRFQTHNDYLVLNKRQDMFQKFEKEAKSQTIWFSEGDWHSRLSIVGDHNKENAAAAFEVSQLLNIIKSSAIQSITSFQGLPGRLEEIGRIRGVRFVNDTTSTTPIAGVKALSSYPLNKIIIIAGGNSKHIPLDSFIKAINKTAKEAIIFKGTAADEFHNITIPTHFVELMDIEKALQISLAQAEPCDIVLFSPGVTHLPEINEFERGEAFVHAFKKKKGE